jgi:hypothetical protein
MGVLKKAALSGAAPVARYAVVAQMDRITNLIFTTQSLS